MKTIPIIFTLCLFSLTFLKAQPLAVDRTDIKDVKVFFQGAEISRTFSTMLPAGRTELKVSNLSTTADPASIVVTSNAVKIISVYNELNFEDRFKKNPLLDKIKDSLDLILDKEQLNELQEQALGEEIKSLLKNSLRIGSAQGMSLDEMDKTSIYLRKKQDEINLLLLQKEKERKWLEQTYQKLKLREQRIRSADSAAATNVYVLVESDIPQKAAFTISYYVKSCGWAPTYNVYSKGIGAPLDMEYRANVLNNSGEDWNKVRLTLLAGNPARSLTLPQMETWVLAYNHKRRSGKVYGYNETGDEGTLSRKQIKNGQQALTKAHEVQEIEVEEGEMTFNIEGLHTIPSTQREYLVDVSRSKLDASYLYQTIPKLDAKAYLVAKVKDWEHLKLIEGNANIFLNDTYMGRTYIDPLGAGDTLELSLGPDPAIQITRVKKKDFSTRKLMGLHLVESFMYEIDVRNLNKNAIFIEIIDQIPIPQQEEIQITLDESKDALYQESIGKLTWKLEIPGAQTAKIKMGYSVKFPRDKMVIIKRTGKVICPKFR
jgi:uncharacterized protein (TIGR02231 family)